MCGKKAHYFSMKVCHSFSGRDIIILTCAYETQLYDRSRSK